MCRKPGRPAKTVPKERLQTMLKLKIPISKICQELHVSRPLIYKAIAKYGINYDRYTALNPDELLAAIREINHPNAGEAIVQGHLEAKGIHVQR